MPTAAGPCRFGVYNVLHKVISEHDYEIGSRIADALCGGDLDPGAVVDEAWLLRVEREHFVSLALNKKTQARIMHTLETGKPLRN